MVRLAVLLASSQLALSQTLEVLHSFSGPDGIWPECGLVQAPDGAFYGTTSSGGANSAGTIFRVAPDGRFSTLLSFSATNGSDPLSSLTLGPDGFFYGTTSGGGLSNAFWPYGYGTVFRISTNGTLTTLVFLNGTNGAWPRDPPIFGADGNLYGVTQGDEWDNCGTVYKLTTGGTMAVLATFSGDESVDQYGIFPNGPPVQVPDGSFYGTTQGGGLPNSVDAYGSGTVFKVTTNGVLTNVANFDGTNSGYPVGGLVLADDGCLYGVTYDPPPGAIFKFTPGGTLTTLYSFSGADGAEPEAGLDQASDHYLYGTTQWGGPSGMFSFGNVFCISTNGVFGSIAVFSGTNGSVPESRLVEGMDGNLYGTTHVGGTGDDGTVFRVVLPPRLCVARIGSALLLSWPTNYTGYALQWSRDLASWTDYATAPTVSVSQFVVTDSTPTNAAFFRLAKNPLPSTGPTGKPPPSARSPG